MIKKTVKYEEHLQVLIFMILGFKILSFLTDEQRTAFFMYANLSMAVLAIIKLVRFYKYANRIINIIWLSSILLMLSGVVLLYLSYQLGMGAATLGIAAFWLTYHHSFLENRPGIQ